MFFDFIFRWLVWQIDMGKHNKANKKAYQKRRKQNKLIKKLNFKKSDNLDSTFDSKASQITPSTSTSSISGIFSFPPSTGKAPESESTKNYSKASHNSSISSISGVFSFPPSIGEASESGIDKCCFAGKKNLNPSQNESHISGVDSCESSESESNLETSVLKTSCKSKFSYIKKLPKEIFCDPLFVRFQERKLLKNRLHQLDSTEF